MGMMGRLTERDKDLIAEAVKGVAANDVALILEVVMALGEFQGRPDQSELYRDIGDLLSKYSTTDMGNIDLADRLLFLRRQCSIFLLITHGRSCPFCIIPVQI